MADDLRFWSMSDARIGAPRGTPTTPSVQLHC
jgi:hypothetical protein